MTMLDPERELHNEKSQPVETGEPREPFDTSNAGYFVFMGMAGILLCGSFAAGNNLLAWSAIAYAALVVSVLYAKHLLRR